MDGSDDEPAKAPLRPGWGGEGQGSGNERASGRRKTTAREAAQADPDAERIDAGPNVVKDAVTAPVIAITTVGIVALSAIAAVWGFGVAYGLFLCWVGIGVVYFHRKPVTREEWAVVAFGLTLVLVGLDTVGLFDLFPFDL